MKEKQGKGGDRETHKGGTEKRTRGGDGETHNFWDRHTDRHTDGHTDGQRFI